MRRELFVLVLLLTQSTKEPVIRLATYFQQNTSSSFWEKLKTQPTNLKLKFLMSYCIHVIKPWRFLQFLNAYSTSITFFSFLNSHFSIRIELSIKMYFLNYTAYFYVGPFYTLQLSIQLTSHALLCFTYTEV